MSLGFGSRPGMHIALLATMMHLVQVAVLTCFIIVYVIIVVVLAARLFAHMFESRSHTLLENGDLHQISAENPVETSHGRSTRKAGALRRNSSPDFRRVRYETFDGPQSNSTVLKHEIGSNT